MIKNSFKIEHLTLFGSLLFIATLLISTFAQAEAFDSRDNKWEFFLQPQYINSKTLEYDNGASADINDRSSLGFGLGYNIDRHIELSVDFSASNSNYTGTRIIDDGANTPEKFSATMYTSSLNFGFTYNILSGPFTPYISANLGSTYIDSGIPTGNIESACWWDPWYGYICSPRAQTFTSTEFHYGIGAGLRYDFNRKLYMKGGINQTFLDLNSSNTADFIVYQFIFGFMF
jgi:opacity protein-like surface antigen